MLNSYGLSAADILEMPDTEITEFIRQRIASHSLSPIVKSLNNDALSDNESVKKTALMALERLGFVTCDSD
ncbi:hypothetical protein [Pseudaestuariivita rosea]|uniref:hypothetical protein n=1 Tax=Pseudaestuariivita rosea TaxID=2763263 RepID=UPI001ABB554C|nr:hypothetical protein [Pseudaestuariivita rosea]